MTPIPNSTTTARGGKLASIPELLRDADFARPNGDRHPDHDRPAGQQRCEEDQGEEYGALVEHA